MALKYYKLIDLINRRNMPRGELQKMAGISSATLAKLGKNEKVSLDVIDRICEALDVQPGDIMEYERESAVDTKL